MGDCSGAADAEGCGPLRQATVVGPKGAVTEPGGSVQRSIDKTYAVAHQLVLLYQLPHFNWVSHAGSWQALEKLEKDGGDRVGCLRRVHPSPKDE